MKSINEMRKNTNPTNELFRQETAGKRRHLKSTILMRVLPVFACLLFAFSANGQIAAICPECKVYLKPEEAKHFDDPAYHEPWCTWVKKKLKDVEPMSEVPSKFSIADQKRLYGYGNGLQCPHCLGTNRHESDCVIGYSQRRAQELLAKAEQATSEQARKRAIWEYQNMENNINILAQAASASTPSQTQSEQTSHHTNTRPFNPPNMSFESSSPSKTHTVTPGTHYDKELSFGNGYTRALGATMPNGAERWVLTNSKGEEVGQFSKVEFVEAGELCQYVLVRDDNGRWGIYDCNGNLMCDPQYENAKMLSSVVNDDGTRLAFFDVTRRDERGVLKHGIFNPEIIEGGLNKIKMNAETIPCEYDYIELIDRSPEPYGTLAKVRKNGLSGIIDTFDGETVIPISYSYMNTYFTPKGGMYFIVGDGNGLGAYHAETMQEVVPVTNGYSLDKVRNLIDKRDL